MRELRNRTAVLLALLLITSCASTPAGKAYQTIASVKLAVDTGMNVWADRVIDGKATPAQQAQIKAAFTEYTRAAGAAAAVMRATTDPAPPNLTGAADALLALLASFGANIGGK